MSEGGINIRFLLWHLKISQDWKVKIEYNSHHLETRLSDGVFKVYEWDMKK